MEDLILTHPQLASFVVYKAERTGKTIGSGSYGIVEEVAIPGAVCAAKHIHSVLIANSNDFTEFVKECKLLSDLRHPHIVQFLGICVLQDSTRDTAIPALLMEKMTTSLHDFLEPHSDQPSSPEPPKPFIPLSLKRSILHDVASGLTYLHEQSPPIIHRDLSARNVLLNSGMVAKIADLGMARIIESMGKAAPMTKAPGASVYMPPEALEACPEDDKRPVEDCDKKAKYNSSIDIFSFGVLSIFTLSQTFPHNVLPQAYEKDCKLISRTELERREKYMKLVYKELEESHPLVQMITRCQGFSSQHPNIHQVLYLLKHDEEEIPPINLMEANKLLKKTVEQQKHIAALTKEKDELGSDLLIANAVIERLETIEKESTDLREMLAKQTEELAILKEKKDQLDSHLSLKNPMASRGSCSQEPQLNPQLSLWSGSNTTRESYERQLQKTTESYERQLQKTVESYEVKIQKLLEHSRGQSQRVQNLKIQLQKRDHALAEFKSKSDHDQQYMEEQQNIISQQENEIKELRGSLETARAAADLYKQDFERERQDREVMAGTIDSLERGGAEKARDKKKSSSLKEMLEQAREEVKAKAAQIKSYKKQVDSLQAQLQAAKQGEIVHVGHPSSSTVKQVDVSSSQKHKKKLPNIFKGKQHKTKEQPWTVVVNEKETKVVNEKEAKVDDKEAMKWKRKERERSVREGKEQRKIKMENMDNDEHLKTYLENELNRLENENEAMENQMECLEATVQFLVSKLEQTEAEVRKSLRRSSEITMIEKGNDSKSSANPNIYVDTSHFSQQQKSHEAIHKRQTSRLLKKNHDYVNLGPGENKSSRKPESLLDKPREQKSPIPTPRSLSMNPSRKGLNSPVSPEEQSISMPAKINPPTYDDYEDHDEVLIEGLEEDIYSGAQEVAETGRDKRTYTLTSIPFDPFLECLYCNEKFRYGQIQQYRRHVNECTGSST